MMKRFWLWLNKPPVEVEIGRQAIQEHMHASQRSLNTRREMRRETEQKVKEVSEILVASLQKDIYR